MSARPLIYVSGAVDPADIRWTPNAMWLVDGDPRDVLWPFPDPWARRLAVVRDALDGMGREFDLLPVEPFGVAMRKALQPDTSPLTQLLEGMR